MVTWCQILANQTYGQNEVANVQVNEVEQQ
jgi:hypothetical protein